MPGCTQLRAVATAAVVGGGLLSVGLVGTASADTPVTVAANQSCYVIQGKTHPPVTVTASGFPASIPVTVDDDLGTDIDTTSNAAGQISVTFPAPNPYLDGPGMKADTLNVGGTDPNTFITYSGTVTLNLTQFDFGDSGTRSAPGLRAFTEKTNWSFSGFPTGHTIWGHYTYNGKVTARQAFGRAQGPCGLLKTRKRLYPATPHHKTYTIQVDSSKKYSRKASPSGRLKLSLRFF